MTEYVMVPKALLFGIIEAAKESCEDRYRETGERHPDYEKALSDIIESAKPVSAEPVEWQFYCEESQKWCGFISEEHKKNTIADGFKIRALYATPQPVSAVPVVFANKNAIQNLHSGDFNRALVASERVDDYVMPLYAAPQPPE